MQGFAIFNTLSRLKAKLDIWVDGVAASMASMIVCLPGATVHMPENAADGSQAVGRDRRGFR